MHWYTQIEHWHWLVLTMLLFIIEVLFGSGIWLWFGVATGLTGVIVLFTALPWYQQGWLFAANLTICMLIWWFAVKSYPQHTDQPMLNRRGEQYIGRLVQLEEAIVHGRGKVKIGDTLWRVMGEDMPAGTTVIIYGVDGVLLQVKAAPRT